MNFQRGTGMLPGMPMDLTIKYFQITVMLKDQSVHKGVRPNEHNDVDSMFILCRNMVFQSYGQDNVIYFQCVQLSKYIDEVRDYLIRHPSKLPDRNKRRYEE